MPKYEVFYARVAETSDNIIVDYPFYAGGSDEIEKANEIADEYRNKRIERDDIEFACMAEVILREDGQTLNDLMDCASRSFAEIEKKLKGDEEEHIPIPTYRGDSRFYVFYCRVTEDKEVGLLVDYSFLAGEADTEEKADQIARDLVNDKAYNGIVLPKVFEKTDDESIMDVMNRAQKRFEKMADHMYESESAIERRMKRKKKKRK